MTKLLLLLLISFQLFAQNPKLFNSLGDTVYNSIENIKKLEEITAFKNNYTFIKSHIKQSETLWAEGMLLDDSSEASLKKGYLKDLRSLSKNHDNLMRSVYKRLDESMKNSDIETFSQIINTNLTPAGASTPDVVAFYKSKVQESIKIDKLEAYLESIKPSPKPVTVAGPSKMDRIQAREKAQAEARKEAQEKIEREKRDALKAEQLNQSR